MRTIDPAKARLLEDFRTSKVREAEPNPAVVPVVSVQASPEDVGSAARLDYYQQVLSHLQHHPAIRDRTKHLSLYLNPAKKSTDPAEWLEMRNTVEYALSLLQVKVVFVDEAQHLMATDSRSRPTAQLDWIKTLANWTNVLHVLVGNFDLYECCHLHGQTVKCTCSDPVLITITKIDIQPQQNRMLWTLTLENVSPNNAGIDFRQFYLQQGDLVSNPTSGEQEYPATGGAANNTVYLQSSGQPGAIQTTTLTLLFMPYATSYTLTSILDPCQRICDPIPFDPAVIKFT